MSDTLYHLTFNTGNVSRTDRRDVRRDVIEALLPVVVAGSGPIPFMEDWNLGVQFTPPHPVGDTWPGAAVFWIARTPGRSDFGLVRAVTAWTEQASAGAWALAEAGYLYNRLKLEGFGGPGFSQPSPDETPPVPWVAAWLSPFIVQASSDELMAFGDLERCIAWTLREASIRGLLH